MILNQTDTGLVCPREAQSLKDRIPEGSLFCFVPVHAFTLAKVLDRLEALEDFEQKIISFRRQFPKAGKP